MNENLKVPLILDGQFFKLLGDGFDIIDNTAEKQSIILKAECQICKEKNKTTVIKGSLKATSNFTTHLKRVHPDRIEKFENYKKLNKVPGKRTATDSSKSPIPKKQATLNSFVSSKKTAAIESKQTLFDRNVIDYIINSMKPLNTVDDPFFMKIIKDLDENINIMSRRTLGRKIDEHFKLVHSNLSQKLKGIQHVSTTADVWSTKYRSFMGVTVHWIDVETLQRQSGVLACRRFHGTHSYDKIAELLCDITSDFNLDNKKIISTVTDNGSNFVKAFAEFGYNLDETKDNYCADEDIEDMTSLTEHYFISESDENNLTCEESNTHTDIDIINNKSDVESVLSQSVSSLILPHHLRCASHTLSLLATTDFLKILKSKSSISKIHYPAFAKCTALWNASRKPKMAEKVKSILKCQLTFPCPTRWNSMYDSVLQILKFKLQLNELLEPNLNCVFKQIDFEYLEEYVKVMQPIAIALDSLQSQKNHYYGQLYPTLTSLKIRLQNLSQESVLRFYGPIIGELIKCLEKRFHIFFEYSSDANPALIATSLHPLFKLRWLPETIKDFEEIKKKIKKLCINVLEGIKNNIEIESDEHLSAISADDEESLYVLGSTSRSLIQKKTDVELEFVRFLACKGTSLNILNEYPLIKKAFIKFNTSLCSSAPVERLFSLAGFIHSPTRGCLSDKNFEKLVFLKGNQNI